MSRSTADLSLSLVAAFAAGLWLAYFIWGAAGLLWTAGIAAIVLVAGVGLCNVLEAMAWGLIRASKGLRRLHEWVRAKLVQRWMGELQL